MADQTPIIVTDSTCDLPHAYFEEYNIELAPLSILFGEESYRSGIDMGLEGFVERLERGDVHPTTSQPTVGDFTTIYQDLAARNRPILSIHISAGLSGTVNAARTAAESLPDLDITVWDSTTISAELGLQVLTAARAARAGKTVSEIVPLLEQTFAASGFLFTLDDLSYLVKGGRIGAVKATIAQTLRIKPIITVSKEGDTRGTYISAGTTRSMKKAEGNFFKQITDRIPAGSKLRAITFHGVGPTPEIAQRLNQRLQEHYECVFIDSGYSTPVLGVHVGPLALAVGYVAGDWPV